MIGHSNMKQASLANKGVAGLQKHLCPNQVRILLLKQPSPEIKIDRIGRMQEITGRE